MAKKRVKKTSRKLSKQDEKKLFAFIASFFTILGFIIALILKKKDKYVMFYAKQGLILFIGQIFISILHSLPIIGWFILGPLLWILWVIVWVITWINSLSGQQKKTIIIGDLAQKIKL